MKEEFLKMNHVLGYFIFIIYFLYIFSDLYVTFSNYKTVSTDNELRKKAIMLSHFITPDKFMKCLSKSFHIFRHTLHISVFVVT